MTKKNEEKLKFDAEISKVLQLMIHSLYTNKDIFLRELVSNASDACDKLRYAALTEPSLAEDGAELSVTIEVDSEQRTISITDTGIGMSREELITNLGTIAKSGTQEFAKQLTGDAKKDMPLIGQFGVGFYSSFMVADKISVISTKAGATESFSWVSDGIGEFTVATAEKAPRGTRITLHIKEGIDDYLDGFRLRHIVQTYSDHISFPIYLLDDDKNPQQINTASALWMRPKNDITAEQYKEFYHHVSHLPDDPWLTLHNKAEGKLEYTSLLFAPSSKPMDLFHPDRKSRVKLYVKRVFITEEHADLVPSYLRFLRGVVDSEDLPLNISRETLQHNPMLIKIKEALVKKFLSELKKKAEKNEEEYKKFWKNFGAVIKEGLCEAYSPREQLLDVCRFHTSNGDNDTVTSLDGYISRMKEKQENIFYLTGENLNTIRQSPQLEGFTARGIEVLLLNDHVDDFWVNTVTDYKLKQLKSITRSDIDLDNIKNNKTDKDEEKPDVPPEGIDKLCERIKTILGDSVSEVRTTKKLGQSAVCLATKEGGMDFRLEQFLIEQKQLVSAAAKILEINPQHAIIRHLAEKPDANIDDAVWLLFDQARILEGEEITDPAAFTRRLQNFVEKSLAA
ncbi:MAG: molecular chaperone HtpG [Rickettsiales bacterium]|jgi:molecular chaperone HtpG